MFVPDKFFILVKHGQVRPELIPARSTSTGVGSDISQKYWTRLEILTKEKGSSLFGLFVILKEIFFIKLTLGVKVIKLFFLCH